MILATSSESTSWIQNFEYIPRLSPVTSVVLDSDVALEQFYCIMGNFGSTNLSLPPLQPSSSSCDTNKFMGTWFVIAVKPTPFETQNSNAVEQYSLVHPLLSSSSSSNAPSSSSSSSSSHDINILFTYNSVEDPYDTKKSNKVKSVPQKGWIMGSNKADSTEWKISPLWPIKASYLIIEIDHVDYQYTVIGYPNRQYCWIMYRHPVMPSILYEELIQKLRTVHHYDLSNLRQVPQLWTANERTKRGFTTQEIPDDQLIGMRMEEK
jgi:apolipoprotein D and lipocalin family protein